jgi:hypothetical protein
MYHSRLLIQLHQVIKIYEINAGKFRTLKRITDKNNSGDIDFTVHNRLDNPDPRLRWDMMTKVTFPGSK